MGRPSSKPTDARGPSNTEVTVLRDGGLHSEAAEAAMRAQHPDSIVKEVQKQINVNVKNNPMQLLAGNFIFTICGRVDFPLIASYSRFLLAPFLGAELAPMGNWTWAQLRGVPIWGDNGRPHPQDVLLATLRTNPTFENAILTITPRWQVPIERLNGDTGTVLISYSDPDGTISRQAREDHIFMFNSYIKFTVSPSRPHLIQCTRCHQFGHAHNSRACRVPVDTLICFKCGGPHRTERHSQECQRVHRDVGVCDCPLKCILCGNTGHHAQDLKCPKRADSAPTRSANQPQVQAQHATREEQGEGWVMVGSKKRSQVPAHPAYRGTGKGKQPPPPSPASDNRSMNKGTSEVQVENDLDWNWGEEPCPGGWDNTSKYMGPGRIQTPAPRNATPGPSHV
ncbi:hypothetical protein EI94DRAFT_1703354 [Lactarius quietus]|nr:hypothetical protein EI94DRAFT_1703354 [Lactarius quietus]